MLQPGLSRPPLLLLQLHDRHRLQTPHIQGIYIYMWGTWHVCAGQELTGVEMGPGPTRISRFLCLFVIYKVKFTLLRFGCSLFSHSCSEFQFSAAPVGGKPG